VPIWLGPADDGTKEAYDMIIQISTAFKRICVTPEYIEATQRVDEFSIKDFNIPDANEGGWPGLAKLLQRPLFDRVWVLQEAILTQKALIKCGNFIEDLRCLEMVLISLYRTFEWHYGFLTGDSRYYMFEANIKSTMQLRKIRAETQCEDLRAEKFELYRLVQEARHCEATNQETKSILCLDSPLISTRTQLDLTTPYPSIMCTPNSLVVVFSKAVALPASLILLPLGMGAKNSPYRPRWLTGELLLSQERSS
jgi:hypothetical protein